MKLSALFFALTEVKQPELGVGSHSVNVSAEVSIFPFADLAPLREMSHSSFVRMQRDALAVWVLRQQNQPLPAGRTPALASFRGSPHARRSAPKTSDPSTTHA